MLIRACLWLENTAGYQSRFGSLYPEEDHGVPAMQYVHHGRQVDCDFAYRQRAL